MQKKLTLPAEEEKAILAEPGESLHYEKIAMLYSS